MNVLSAFFFTRLDHVVHSDLYRYSLAFSYEWASQYWIYARLMLSFLGLGTAMTIISFALILVGSCTREIQLFPNMRALLKVDLTKLICSILLSVGVITLVFSINSNSPTLAFIGLGLVFWGAILFYLRPEKYVKESLLNTTAFPLFANLERILNEFNCEGKGVYLPPNYLNDSQSSLVFIPSRAEKTLQKPEQVDQEKLYSENPRGILLTPPGVALSKVFEKELGKSLTKIGLNCIQEKLPKLLIEDFEIAEDIKINVENSIVTINITNHIFNQICQETRKLPKTSESVGCTLCSAIACVLSKAAGQPVEIKKEEQSQDGKTTKIQYQILKE